jgi:hypothetical protein
LFQRLAFILVLNYLLIMTYDFFADKQDKIDLLNFIFKITDLQIFDVFGTRGKDNKVQDGK